MMLSLSTTPDACRLNVSAARFEHRTCTTSRQDVQRHAAVSKRSSVVDL